MIMSEEEILELIELADKLQEEIDELIKDYEHYLEI